MPKKRKEPSSSSGTGDGKTKGRKSPIPTTDKSNNSDLPPSAGYLISCDVPTKQYIQYLNQLKPIDKKFIITDLDATHLLVKAKAREEISRKVEEWMDEVRKELFFKKMDWLECLISDTSFPLFISFSFHEFRMSSPLWNELEKIWICRKHSEKIENS